MANTGYKGYTNLEQYYTDDSSATGTTKANAIGGADYIAPVSDTGTCPAIFNSVVYSEPAIRNNCSTGYAGTSIVLTATAGQFTSSTSQADADSQAVTWVQTNKQSNANTYGACNIINYLTPSSYSLTWNYDQSGYGYYASITITSLTGWFVASIPSGFEVTDDSGSSVNSSNLFYSGQTIRVYPSGSPGDTGDLIITSLDGIITTIVLLHYSAPSTINLTIVNGDSDTLLSWTDESASILEGTTTIAITMTVSYPFSDVTPNYSIDRNGHNAGSGAITLYSGSNSFNLTMTETAVAGDTITITINY